MYLVRVHKEFADLRHKMGAGASVITDGKDKYTKEEVQALAGDRFDDKVYESVAEFDGSLTKENLAILQHRLSIKPFMLPRLKSTLAKVYADGKTPVILDSTEDGSKIDTFLQYGAGAVIVDGKKLVGDLYFRKSKSHEEVQDELRDILVKCLGYKADSSAVGPRIGMDMIFLLGDSALDFNKLFNPKKFPVQLFEPGAIYNKEVYQPILDAHPTLPDIETKIEPSNGFRLLITSRFEDADAAEFLIGSLPLDKCCLLSVRTGSVEKPWIPKHGELAIQKSLAAVIVVKVLKCSGVEKDEDGLDTVKNAVCNVKFLDGSSKGGIPLSDLTKAPADTKFEPKASATASAEPAAAAASATATESKPQAKGKKKKAKAKATKSKKKKR